MEVPWILTRREIALLYHRPPMEIDQWPSDEIAAELEIQGIIANATQRRRLTQ
jgi:hypothetical protein